MKISPKMLHLPPYLSVAWSQISALYLKGTDLMVALLDNSQIAVPDLDKDSLDSIFAAHATYLESSHRRTSGEAKPSLQILTTSLPLDSQGQPLDMDGAAAMGAAMQHNPAQANMPDLPAEIISKITEISRIMAPEEMESVPRPEPHCNCMHCQIARGIHGLSKEQVDTVHLIEEVADKDEEVSDEELKFQEWRITQMGDKLYSVTNKLDPNEKYSVYLGDPLGCTCGRKGCAHIPAVLNS